MDGSYLNAIKAFEGFAATAQADYAQTSVGYGTRARHAGETITPAEADKRFREEIAEAHAIVERVAPQADAGTKAALTSLTFNAGDQWTRSGLGEAVRHNDLAAVKSTFVEYNKAGGQVLAGLVARRLVEASWIGAVGTNNTVVAGPAATVAPLAVAASSSGTTGTDILLEGTSPREQPPPMAPLTLLTPQTAFGAGAFDVASPTGDGLPLWWSIVERLKEQLVREATLPSDPRNGVSRSSV